MDDKDRQQLERKITKYRALARQAADDEAAKRIFELTAELEQQARDMERRGK